MQKKIIPYKILYLLSLIPVLGMLVAWLCSWLNIYRKTADKKYIFLHYVLWMLAFCGLGVFIAIYVIVVVPIFNEQLKFIFGLMLGYLVCLISAIACVCISKRIIKKYDLNSLK